MSNLLEQELETLEGFEAWLKEQEAAQIVGQARTSCHCPLAKWLTDFYRMPIEVGTNGFSVGDGRCRHSPLTWQFIRWIDEWSTSRAPVTAAQALRALKSARKAARGGES